jgi:Co/Zn/Cd efflux system component
MPSWAFPVVLCAVIAFMLYRRYKRTFGPQRVWPVGITVRGVLLLLVAIPVFVTTVHTSMTSVAAAFLGFAAGLLLAVYSLSKTTFSVTPEGRFYIPDPYVGITITGMFLLRMAWRFTQDGGALFQRGADGGIHGHATSAVTVALFFVLTAYYWTFFSGVLYRAPAAAPERAVS